VLREATGVRPSEHDNDQGLEEANQPDDGLRTRNHAQAAAVEGLLGIKIARTLRFWTANQRTMESRQPLC